MKVPDLNAWAKVAEDVNSFTVKSYPDCVFEVNVNWKLDAVRDLEEDQSVWGVFDRMSVAGMIEDALNRILSDRHQAALRKKLSRRHGAGAEMPQKRQ